MTKKQLQEDYDKLDKEHTELCNKLMIFNLREAICGQVKQCDNLDYLFKMADYCGAANGMRLAFDEIDDIYYVPSRGSV